MEHNAKTCSHVLGLKWTAALLEERCMDGRPLALGGAGGVVSTLLVSFLRGVSQEVDLSVAAEVLGNRCAEFPQPTSEDLPWIFLAVGFVAGVCLGPCIDICWLLRQRWRRFVWYQVTSNTGTLQQSPQNRPLFKVLA